MKKKCVIITLLAMLLFAALVSCSDSSDKLSSGEGDYVFDGIEFIEGNNSECYEVLRSWSHPEKEPIKITRRLITLTLEETQKDPNNNTFIVKHGDTELECSGEDLRDIVGDNFSAAKGIETGDVILLPKGIINVEGTAGDPLSVHDVTIVGHSEGTTLCLYPKNSNNYRTIRLYHRQNDNDIRFVNMYRLTLDGSGIADKRANCIYTTAYGGIIAMKDVIIKNYGNAVFSIWGAEARDDGSYPSREENLGVDIYLKNVKTENTSKLIRFDIMPYVGGGTGNQAGWSYGCLNYDSECSFNTTAYDFPNRTGQENAFINGQLIDEAKPAK